jgi:NAD(P)-dependent dehydrogenase (short-subunit alcohol dehydrogenase family)
LLLLKKGDKGFANISVISSILGANPIPSQGLYSMTKACLDDMVKWMTMELMNDDIRINAIAPGVITTEFSGVLWEKSHDVIKKSLGAPEEIAALATTICSKDGNYMNGTSYQITGG